MIEVSAAVTGTIASEILHAAEDVVDCLLDVGESRFGRGRERLDGLPRLLSGLGLGRAERSQLRVRSSVAERMSVPA